MLSSIKGAVGAGYNQVRLSSMLTADVARILKKMSKKSRYEALATKEAMEAFIHKIHPQLSEPVRMHVTTEDLIPIVEAKREHIMKKEKNKKRLSRTLSKL